MEKQEQVKPETSGKLDDKGQRAHEKLQDWGWIPRKSKAYLEGWNPAPPFHFWEGERGCRLNLTTEDK